MIEINFKMSLSMYGGKQLICYTCPVPFRGIKMRSKVVCPHRTGRFNDWPAAVIQYNAQHSVRGGKEGQTKLAPCPNVSSLDSKFSSHDRPPSKLQLQHTGKLLKKNNYKRLREGERIWRLKEWETFSLRNYSSTHKVALLYNKYSSRIQ